MIGREAATASTANAEPGLIERSHDLVIGNGYPVSRGMVIGNGYPESRGNEGDERGIYLSDDVL